MASLVPEYLVDANPNRKIHHIDENSFRAYGRVHRLLKVENYLDYLEKEVQVTEELFYGADCLGTSFNSDELNPIIANVYGGLSDIQVGICHGKNKKLNALEYHKGTETIITATEMVILLGLIDDIEWTAGTYDTSRIQAFYVPKGTVYELSARCLHYAPIHIHEDEGFKLVVLLPKGTNEALDSLPAQEDEGMFLLAQNKWLIAHADDKSFADLGAHLGLVGENIEIKTERQ